MKRICDFIAKWMGVIVLLVAAISLFVLSSPAWIGTWVINPMLGIIMFGMGLTLSAKDLKIVLNMVTVNQAKHLLRQPNMLVKQVAYELGFPEQFTFRKYFKSHTGQSPTEYQQAQKTDGKNIDK